MISSIARFASSVSVQELLRITHDGPTGARATSAQHAPLHRAHVLRFVHEEVGVSLVRQLEWVDFSRRWRDGVVKTFIPLSQDR